MSFVIYQCTQGACNRIILDLYTTSLTIAFIIFILIVLRWMFTPSKKKTQQISLDTETFNSNGEDIMALELSHEELYKSLNFLLMYGVITFEEYNQLQMKGLPYLINKPSN